MNTQQIPNKIIKFFKPLGNDRISTVTACIVPKDILPIQGHCNRLNEVCVLQAFRLLSAGHGVCVCVASVPATVRRAYLCYYICVLYTHDHTLTARPDLTHYPIP